MPGPPRWYGELLLDMVHNLYAQVGDVDRAARRLCELVRKAEAGAGRKARVDANRHRSLAREVAGEAMVLLKNDRSVLPLDPSRLTTLAVLGPAAADVQISGGGSSRVEPASFVTPLEGITRALNGTVEILHEKGCDNRAWYEPVDVAHLKHPTTGEPGLKAEYFSDTSFRRPPTAVRTDSFSDLFFEWIPLPEGIDAGAGFAVGRGIQRRRDRPRPGNRHASAHGCPVAPWTFKVRRPKCRLWESSRVPPTSSGRS